jgi:hypothetical protein
MTGPSRMVAAVSVLAEHCNMQQSFNIHITVDVA